MKITILEKTEEPSEEQVEAAHQRVYGSLVSLFEQLKHYAGLSDRTLIVT